MSTNLPARRLAKQLTDARRIADAMLAGVAGVMRVSVQTHADGTVTIVTRVKPTTAPKQQQQQPAASGEGW